MEAVPSSPWKQRARSSLPLASDGTRAGDHDVWSLWLPPGNSSPARPLLPPPKALVGSPARPVPPPLHGRQRLLQGGRKKQAIDLGASVSLGGGGMFGTIVPVQLTYAAEGSNPRVAGGVPGRPATHTCAPRRGQVHRHGKALLPRGQRLRRRGGAGAGRWGAGAGAADWHGGGGGV
eukprot:scaffold52996_cov46-Phaeocystis_antarctica.AAC.2